MVLCNYEREKIDLTIVMPSYNRGQYITKAIESILSQKTKYNYKLVIADDYSTDNSVKIIRQYEERYPDKICANYSNINRGIFNNTLSVFANMSSEYFCVMDADDYWINDNFIQDAIDFLNVHKDFVCYSGNTVYVKDDIETEEEYFSIDSGDYVIDSIQTYFNQKSIIPHTTGGIYRNVVYNGKIPKFLDNIKDNLSRHSWRADTGRFMLHLKYGKIYFKDYLVGAYRIHAGGVWSGSTAFHRFVLNARAFLDYMDYYEEEERENFIQHVKADMRRANGFLFSQSIHDRFYKISAEDYENYIYCNNRLSKLQSEKKQMISSNFEIKQQIYNLSTLNKNIVIWGTGSAAINLLNTYNIKGEQILYFIDKNTEKQGKTFMEKRIMPPKQIKSDNIEYIVIASSYYPEIEEELVREDYCSSNKIINLYKINEVLTMLESKEGD